LELEPELNQELETCANTIDSRFGTDEETSSGEYTICCVVIQLTSILQTRAAYSANLKVEMSIERKTRDLRV